jgi:hypothetical protein
MIYGLNTHVCFEWLKERGYARPRFGRPESYWELCKRPTPADFDEWLEKLLFLAQSGAFFRGFDEQGHETPGELMFGSTFCH